MPNIKKILEKITSLTLLKVFLIYVLATPITTAKQINIVGSDTLESLLYSWTDKYNSQHPDIKFKIIAKGSSTAIKALINEESDLGPMSRRIKQSESRAFQTKFGYKPFGIRVAIDALGVFVNKDNPVSQVTIEQLDAIFSQNRACGAPSSLQNWSNIGGNNANIQIFGRGAESGTSNYFKKRALCSGDYAESLQIMSHNSNILDKLQTEINAIGYLPVGLNMSSIKPLSIARSDQKEFVNPLDKKIVKEGKYPLSRFLYIYINKNPHQELKPHVKKFLEYVLSSEGQKHVEQQGFISLTDTLLTKQKKVIQFKGSNSDKNKIDKAKVETKPVICEIPGINALDEQPASMIDENSKSSELEDQLEDIMYEEPQNSNLKEQPDEILMEDAKAKSINVLEEEQPNEMSVEDAKEKSINVLKEEQLNEMSVENAKEKSINVLEEEQLNEMSVENAKEKSTNVLKEEQQQPDEAMIDGSLESYEDLENFEYGIK